MKPALAAALPIVLVAIAASGCGSRAPVPHTFTAVPSRPRPTQVQVIPPGPGALTASVRRPTTMRGAPGARAVGVVGPHTQFGSPEVLSVVRVRARWVGVLSELAGNGRLGWIPRSAALLGRDVWSVRASLSRRTLTVFESGRVIQRYTIGVGALGSPTPTGGFAVTDRLRTGQPGGPYGCCILALTATAPHAIPGWTGGNRIAVHATPATETIGQPDSHGCLHVSQAAGRWLIYHVPDGTPVKISA